MLFQLYSAALRSPPHPLPTSRCPHIRLNSRSHINIELTADTTVSTAKDPLSKLLKMASSSRETFPLYPDWHRRESLHNDATLFSCPRCRSSQVDPGILPSSPKRVITSCSLLRFSCGQRRAQCCATTSGRDTAANATQKGRENAIRDICAVQPAQISFWKTLSQTRGCRTYLCL